MTTYRPSEESLSAFRQIQQLYPLLLTSVTSLKAEQWEVLEATLQGKDVVCCLPTGYGKSMTYIIQPLLQDIFFPGTLHTALVISPLLSIIKEQVAYLNNAGVRAVHLTAYNNGRGNEQIWFATAEYVGSKAFRVFLRSRQERVAVLVADEFHCISTWGLKFRKSYRRVSELVACVEAPLLLLTATATPAVKNDVLELFGLQTPTVVARTPDRPNIKIVVQQVTHSPKCMQWLIDKLLAEGPRCAKTVVFCISSEDASRLFLWALDQLDHAGKAYTNSEAIMEDRVVDMYHSAVAEDALKRVEDEFPKANSIIRVLFSTIKLGMGVDIEDLNHVVLYGVPETMMDLWQEVGRCGRAPGAKGTATIFVTKRSLARSPEPAVCSLDYKDKCYRAKIMAAFCQTATTTTCKRIRCLAQCAECACEFCSCCNYCQEQCPCS